MHNVAQQKKIIEEIQVFIEYSVGEKERRIALETLQSCKDNSLALIVLRDFYSRLPELREEAVSRISKIVSRQGMYLLSVNTRSYEYLYFFNGEKPIYLGEKSDGIGDTEVLSFFGYRSDADFLKKIEKDIEGQEDIVEDHAVFCPVCGVAEGEIHQLGCPVEICPWCNSQFNYCNCRFEKLGVDEIVEESQLDMLEILLNEKGRVVFEADQAPAYPSGGQDEEY